MSALEYALQFYGFLIQTVPVALLWYVPFPSESLRISGKRSFALLDGDAHRFCSGIHSALRLPEGGRKGAGRVYAVCCQFLYGDRAAYRGRSVF